MNVDNGVCVYIYICVCVCVPVPLCNDVRVCLCIGYAGENIQNSEELET